MKETTLAKAVRSFNSPALAKEYGGRRATLTVVAHAYQLGGNQHPHFSVTCDLRVDGRDAAGGCMHKEALRFWPAISPVVDMHLSNADDGEPMHGEANGWYWMAGALGGAGERYHGGNSERQHWKDNGDFDGYRFSTPDEALKTMAEHLRISMEDAEALRNHLSDVVQADADYNGAMDWSLARRHFSNFVNAQRERWKTEAITALDLIRSLA